MRDSTFAWGMAPASARAFPNDSTLDDDDTWAAKVLAETPAADVDVSACTLRTDVSAVPVLLLREFLVRLAGRLLGWTADTRRLVPAATVRSALTSSETPPHFWFVSLTACFPTEGSVVTRCATIDCLLDAAHVERSGVVHIEDTGAVPEEQTSSTVLPFNARSDELLV